MENIPLADSSIQQCYIFRTTAGVRYTVESSTDLTNWTSQDEIYGLGNEYVVTMREYTPPPPPPPGTPPVIRPAPAINASIRLQRASGPEGGIVVAWPSHDHGGPIVVRIAGEMDPGWNQIPLFSNRFGGYYFFIWHPWDLVAPPTVNSILGPKDSALLAALEASLPAMNQQVADSVFRSRNSPMPDSELPGSKRFWCVKVDPNVDTDQDGSPDWAEFEIVARGTGMLVPGVIGDAFDPDVNRDGIPDGEQLDADGDETPDAKDPDAADNAAFMPLTPLPRYALFEIPGKAIQINDRGTVIFPTKVWQGGVLSDLPGGSATARGISDSDVILGTEWASVADPTQSPLGKVCYWPSPTSPHQTLQVTEGGVPVFAYSHHDATSAQGPAPLLTSDGKFIEHGWVETPPENYRDLYDNHPTLWQIPSGGGSTASRAAAPAGASHLSDASLSWGINPYTETRPDDEIGRINAPVTLPPLPFVPHNVISLPRPTGEATYFATKNPGWEGLESGTLVFILGKWRNAGIYAHAVDISSNGTAIGYSKDEKIGAILLNGKWTSLSRAAPGIASAWLETPNAMLLDTTPNGWVLAKDGINEKSAAMLPIKVAGLPLNESLAEDATGVDVTSIAAADDGESVGSKIWIMAPAVAGSTQITLKAPLSTHAALKISAAGIRFEGADDKTLTAPSTTFALESPGTTIASGTEVPLQLHLMDSTPSNGSAGETVSSSNPLSLKVMKSRTIKITLYKVTKETSGQADNTADLFPSAEALQTYLDAIFKPQLNAVTQVTDAPTTLKLNWDLNGNGSMDVGSLTQTGSEQNAILNAKPTDASVTNINVFLLGTDKKINGDTAWGLTNRSQNACWVVADTFANPADPSSGRNIAELLQTIAHEIGHVLTGYGHPDEEGGSSPLKGTDRKQRLMHSGDGLTKKVADTYLRMARGHRLVKKEWDAAEEWLSHRPAGDN